jgi:hypothetical protein
MISRWDKKSAMPIDSRFVGKKTMIHHRLLCLLR